MLVTRDARRYSSFPELARFPESGRNMKQAIPACLALLLLACLGALTFAPPPVLAREDDLDNRAQRVGWARLKVPGPQNLWRRHAEADPILAQFLQAETTLNIDPTWYVADVEDLREMCVYPLLFAQSVAAIHTPSGKANLAEYLRRGGFLFIDQCCNRDFNPDDDQFLMDQQRLIKEILPESRIVVLPEDHEIYRNCFEIKGGPPHTYFENIYDPQRASRGLYGIMRGNSMVGIITLSGLQCGWAGMISPPGHDVQCMKMAINIYIYAMTQTEK